MSVGAAEHTQSEAQGSCPWLAVLAAATAIVVLTALQGLNQRPEWPGKGMTSTSASMSQAEPASFHSIRNPITKAL
ncbi:hypothetical protein J2S98_001614 [Arthrobacter oryzae]|nr:hypothetical protein [Arthrobacter oryzae]